MSYANSAYQAQASGSRFHHPSNPTHAQPSPLTTAPDFDILDWHPAYESCQRYFLDHAQHEPGTQALCALINIRLPFQWPSNPVHSSTQPSQQNNPGPSSYTHGQWPRPPPSPINRGANQSQPAPAFVSLIPYIRRLVITGFDKPGILHGLFGDAYSAGITPMQDCERRNYLFAAKHGGWRTCKKQYDMNPEETVPFLKPLQNVRGEELEAAEKSWSSWLAMEDWMLGPREPPTDDHAEPFVRARVADGAGPPWNQASFNFNPGFRDEMSDDLK